jgi:hypothetical protein
MLIVLLLPVFFMTLHGCGSGRSEIAQQQQDREMAASASAKDEKTNEDYASRAKRLDAATIAAVPVAPLTSQEALDEYSSRLADLKFLIASAEKDSLVELSRSNRQPPVEPSLKLAKETLASGMVTKGKAQLAMKDFDGGRNTLRQVLATFDPKVYGHLTTLAESTLQDIETFEGREEDPLRGRQ